MTRSRAAALALVFTGSGAAGLFSEQAFEKLLGTLLGTSTQAGAVVLSTYFGGLTLGAFAYARRPRRRALAAYASLEATIALVCALLATSCDRLGPIFLPVLRAGAAEGAPALLATRLVVAACWILPVAVPLGATFPAVVDALDAVRDGARRRAAVSTFYALNLLGAIAAAALGPFVVFPRLGVDGTLGLAAGLDAVAAAVAFAVAVAVASGTGTTSMHARANAEEEAGAAWGRAEMPLLAVAATSGFVLFGLEVVWTHLIGTVLGSSAYAFGSMLAVVLAGLGAGAAAAAALASRLGRVPPLAPGAALAATALLLALGHARWPEAPHDLAVLARDATSFAGAEAARAWIAVRLLFAPTVALGAVYPLLLRLHAFPRAHAGPTSARMAAANAVGAALGALLVGFVAIPTIGSDRTLRAIGAFALVAGAGIVLAYRGGASRARGRAALLAGVALVASVALLAASPPWDRLHLTSGEQVYFTHFAVFPDTRLRFFREDTAGGFTTVVENEVHGASVRWLLTNGKFQGNDGGEMAAQDGFALVPMQYVRAWDDALVIGLGTGRSAYAVATMGFARVTIAEIAPSIAAAARTEFAHVNGRVLERPNVRLALDDGRNLLMLEDRSYDLVSMEVTSVWFAGATNVYSREFYEAARARLRPGGVLQQWIQMHHIAEDDLDTVIATVRGAFRHVSFFVGGGQGVLVASDEAQIVRREFFERFAAHRGELALRDAAELAASRLLSPSDVDALVLRARPVPNTDRNRRLEWTTPRYACERRDMQRENVLALAAASAREPPAVAADARGADADAVRAVDAAAIERTFGVPPRR